MEIKAIGYCRVSTKDQKEHGTSIPDQREKIAKCCASHGWQLLDILEDNQTGTEMEAREGLQEVLRRIDEWDVMVLTKPDRLSRSFGDAENLFKRTFEPLHKNVWSIEMEINLTISPEMRQFKSVIADMEVRGIRTRVNEGMKFASESGYWVGKPPLGYKMKIIGKSHKDRKILVPDDDEVKTLQNIFYGAFIGSSELDIKKETGVDRKTIHYILRNPIYYGYRKLVTTTTDREEGLMVRTRKHTIWVKHDYPIIVEKEILAKCFIMFDIANKIKETEVVKK